MASASSGETGGASPEILDDGRADPSGEWLMSVEEVADKLKGQELLDSAHVYALVRKTTEILDDEPNIIELAAPVTVVGDIHGQFYDMVNMFDKNGWPGDTHTYCFLGDYVDRGQFSCEVSRIRRLTGTAP